MEKKIPVLILIYVSLALISMKCDGNKTIAIDVNKVCSGKVDSVNNYWHDVVKNLIIPDTVYLVGDSTAIHWIDSVSIRYIDSVRYTKGKLVEIIPDTVTDNFHYKNNIPLQLVDGDLETRWLSSSFNQIACFNFGKIVYIDSIYISTYKNLPTKIKVNNIEEGKTDTLLTKNQLWTGFKLGYINQLFYLETISSENDWSDLNEVVFIGREIRND